MAEKSRRQQLEEFLAEDPNDPFLRYGLAMEYLTEGNQEAALRCLQELIAVVPTYPPAYLQAGQLLTQLGRTSEAKEIFRSGIAAAQQQGDLHAAGEMQEMLLALEP